MATLRDYFETDFAAFSTLNRPLVVTIGADSLAVDGRVHLAPETGGTFASLYIPKSPVAAEVVAHFIQSPEEILSVADSILTRYSRGGESPMKSEDLVFTGRLFVYTEEEFADGDSDSLRILANSKKIGLQFRGPAYANNRAAHEKPLAFISHDSRDKVDIARPMTEALAKHHCPVWYDEYSLRPGQSLRGSIEKGLKEAKKCVLVLTPNFLSNAGWTKTEFDSVFTRQTIEKRLVVLPIWAGVSQPDVYQYSPSLANVVAIDWRLGPDEVARRLAREITRDD